MRQAVQGAIEVEAELRTPKARVQLVQYHFSEPPSSVLRAETNFRLELCLTSRHRSARGSYRDQWSTRRFERIGDIFLAAPELDLVARSDEARSLTSVICEVGRDTVLELYDTPPELTDQLLAASLDIRDAKIRALLLRLAEEARQPGFASELLVELVAGQMAIELFRHGRAVAECQAQGGLAPWQLRLIDERLREVREAPTLPVLAELCRISVRQLARGFRASRGASIGAYVAEAQVAHAKQLLAAGESVAAIAQMLGFSCSSNFGLAFRRATGLAPGQFREILLRRYTNPC